MKHAGPEELSHLHNLLADLRALPGVEEMIHGTYHHSGAALLTFHAGTAGCTGRLRAGKGWKSYPVNTPEEQTALLERVRSGLPSAKVAEPKPPGDSSRITHGQKLGPRSPTPLPKPATHARKAGRIPGRVD